MCFQIPKKVKSVKGANAIVEGDMNIMLGTIKVSPGDYLMVYGNMAVEKISKEKAAYSRRLVKSIEDSL